MANRIARRFLMPLAALGLAAVLGGCVVYPAYPSYGYGYGYGYPEPHYHGGYGYYHGGYGYGWRR
jgi:hypothetical protein